jgi:tetratricopeptide (TPR) repeat protein
MRRSNSPCSRICVTALLALISAALPAAAIASIAEAQSLLAKGQRGQALEKVEQVLATSPKDRQARFLKGVILAEMNKLPEATATFIKLTEDAPELPEPYNNLAVIYAQQQQYDKARAALEMAIRTHPSYAVAHENLGDLYTKMARQAYDRALQIDSKNPNAQAKLNLLRDISASSPGQPVVSKAAASSAPRPVVVASAASAASVATSTVSVSSAPRPAVSSSISSSKEASSSIASSSSAASSSSKPVPAQTNQTDEIGKTVLAWASAWSAQNARDYLAHYATDFEIPDGKSRKVWEAERTDRISRPARIRVSISELKISVNEGTAQASFRQRYESSSLNSATAKTLDLKLQDGRWRIVRERVGR